MVIKTLSGFSHHSCESTSDVLFFSIAGPSADRSHDERFMISMCCRNQYYQCK